MRRSALAGAVVAVACVLSLAGSDALAQPSDGPSDLRRLMEAFQLRDAALGTLRIADESVKRCLALQQDAGNNADVANVLNGIRVKPGSLDFVSPDTLAELQRAAGRPINSPRHFVPTAPGPRQISWPSRVLKGADEVRVGDVLWFQGDDGAMAPGQVAEVSSRLEFGAFNPLTLSGTIVVDGVVASAHSDWFLDGIASANVQGTVQTLFAPVRAIYWVIGPKWTLEISERWGVVDLVRETTSPAPGRRVDWLLAVLLALGAVERRRGGRAVARRTS